MRRKRGKKISIIILVLIFSLIVFSLLGIAFYFNYFTGKITQTGYGDTGYGTTGYGIDLNNGLVAHYEFEGNVLDTSGNNNNGVLKGNYSFYEGIKNKAIKLNQGYIDIPYSNSMKVFPSSQWTFSVWIKPEGTGETYQELLQGFWHRPRIDYVSVNNNLFFGFFNSSNSYVGSLWAGVNTTKKNEWSHAVLVADGTNYIWYVNGVEKSRTKYQAISSSNPSLYRIGAGNGGSYFKGLMDDYRIYNRALTIEEVNKLYSEVTSSGVGNPSQNLVGNNFVNLIKNGNFETSNTLPPSNWVIYDNCYQIGGISCQINNYYSSVDKIEGSKSYYHTITGGSANGGGVGLQQDVYGLEVGKSYILKLWVRVEYGTASIWVDNGNDNNPLVSENDIQLNDWTEKAYRFTATSDRARIFLRRAWGNNQPMKAYWDDVRLYREIVPESIKCGDLIVGIEQGEQCDDGNKVNGDGCDENCVYEGKLKVEVIQPYNGIGDIGLYKFNPFEMSYSILSNTLKTINSFEINSKDNLDLVLYGPNAPVDKKIVSGNGWIKAKLIKGNEIQSQYIVKLDGDVATFTQALASDFSMNTDPQSLGEYSLEISQCPENVISDIDWSLHPFYSLNPEGYNPNSLDLVEYEKGDFDKYYKKYSDKCQQAIGTLKIKVSLGQKTQISSSTITSYAASAPVEDCSLGLNSNRFNDYYGAYYLDGETQEFPNWANEPCKSFWIDECCDMNTQYKTLKVLHILKNDREDLKAKLVDCNMGLVLQRVEAFKGQLMQTEFNLQNGMAGGVLIQTGISEVDNELIQLDNKATTTCLHSSETVPYYYTTEDHYDCQGVFPKGECLEATQKYQRKLIEAVKIKIAQVYFSSGVADGYMEYKDTFEGNTGGKSAKIAGLKARAILPLLGYSNTRQKTLSDSEKKIIDTKLSVEYFGKAYTESKKYYKFKEFNPTRDAPAVGNYGFQKKIGDEIIYSEGTCSGMTYVIQKFFHNSVPTPPSFNQEKCGADDFKILADNVEFRAESRGRYPMPFSGLKDVYNKCDDDGVSSAGEMMKYRQLGQKKYRKDSVVISKGDEPAQRRELISILTEGYAPYVGIRFSGVFGGHAILVYNSDDIGGLFDVYDPNYIYAGILGFIGKSTRIMYDADRDKWIYITPRGGHTSNVDGTGVEDYGRIYLTSFVSSDIIRRHQTCGCSPICSTNREETSYIWNYRFFDKSATGCTS